MAKSINHSTRNMLNISVFISWSPFHIWVYDITWVQNHKTVLKGGKVTKSYHRLCHLINRVQLIHQKWLKLYGHKILGVIYQIRRIGGKITCLLYWQKYSRPTHLRGKMIDWWQSGSTGTGQAGEQGLGNELLYRLQLPKGPRTGTIWIGMMAGNTNLVT